MLEDIKRTLARTVQAAEGEYDDVVICGGDRTLARFADRVVLLLYDKDRDGQIDWDYFGGKNVNAICFPDKEEGGNLSRVVRLLVDSDEKLMDRQEIEIL